MKKYLILILIALSSFVYGQSHYIGFKGGASLTKVNDISYADDVEFRFGFTAGLSYEYKLKNNILLAADLQYIQKGYDFDIAFTNDEGLLVGEGKSHMKYDYISLPIKVGYSIGERFSGFFNLGVAPALLTKAYYDFSDPNGILPEIEEFEGVDITEETPKFELSGLAEIGANYKINEKFIITTAVTSQYGLTAMTNFDNQDNTIKNYGFYWTVGLKYALN